MAQPAGGNRAAVASALPALPFGWQWQETAVRESQAPQAVARPREGWPGEAGGLQVGLAGAQYKRSRLDAEAARLSSVVPLDVPVFAGIANRATATSPGLNHR